MRINLLSLTVVTLTLVVQGCREGPHRVANDRDERRERSENPERPELRDKDSPAYKAGVAAHEIANGAARAAAAAGRKLDEGARKAREGWKEKGIEDRQKTRTDSTGRP